MYHWIKYFDTTGVVQEFPQVINMASETQDSPAYHLAGSDRTTEMHCIFKYTLSGTGMFRDASGDHRVPEGWGFLCEIGDPATAYFYPENGKEPWTFVYGCFRGEIAKSMVRILINKWGHLYQLDKDSPLIKWMTSFAGKSESRFQLLSAESSRMVFDLLLRLASSHEESSSASGEHRLVRRAISAIDDKIGTPLNATTLAHDLGVSREHLTRVFSRQMGQSPYEYIQSRKLKLAGRLLKESVLSIKEVAGQTGFKRAEHFNRSFKTFSGMTPGKFRYRGNLATV